MADNSSYDAEYLKFVGFELWRLLSKAFGEKVNKRNLHTVFKQKAQQISELAVQPETGQRGAAPKLMGFKEVIDLQHQDWGEAVDVSVFYGRTQELATLEQWIVSDRCRLVTLLGIGGIGKTTLSVRIAEQIQNEFEYVVWRSLRNAPLIKDILAQLIQFLSNQQETQLAETVEGKISQLIDYLRSSRCLLVLDNFETVLQRGEYTGYYQDGYEGYGELLRRVGETHHQSCLLLTSREKPVGVALLEAEDLPSRLLQLTGLQEPEAQKIIKAKNLVGSEEDTRKLICCYRGNPLALKIASTSIQYLFESNISKFLHQSTTVFNNIAVVLEQQFNRLSALEEQIMYWLAINREPISYVELQEDIIPPISNQKLLSALESLRWRSLIEKATPTLIEQTPAGFTQQAVVMEYITEELIEQICQEIITEELQLFIRYALLKAEAKDYIRESQTRIIVEPILDKLSVTYTQQELEKKLNRILLKLREQFSTPGYGGGNVINLLRQLKINLTGYDFSHLRVCQAYLQDVSLHQVNFAHADLTKCVFAKTFGGIVSVAFSSDRQLLATSDTNGEIQVWKVKNGNQLFICKGHNSWVWFVAFSPNNQILASCSQDHTVKLWNVSTGECLKTLHGHSSIVTCIAFSSQGNTLASSSEDQTIKLWDIYTGECTATLEGHINCVWGVAFSPDGETLASGAEDRMIRLWNVSTGECRQTWQAHSKWIKSIAFSPDGQMLASGSFDSSVKLWDVNTSECLKTLQGHTSSVTSLSFSPDGLLASGSYDSYVKLWDVNTSECIKTLQGHTNRVWSVAFSRDGQVLVSGGDDHSAKLWDVRGSQCFKTLQGHSNSIYSIALSPDSQLLASGHEDQTIKLWDISTKVFKTETSSCVTDSDFTEQCLRTLQGHSNRVFCVAFSPDGQTLASCSGDRTIKLWNPTTGECIKTLQGHSSWVWSVAFSPDGQMLASSSYDHTVKLWDVSTGECLQTLPGHTSSVLAIAFNPNGQLLASGGYEQTIKLWQVNTGECLQTLHGHTNRVWSVTFGPNGHLVSGGDDHTVKLWDMSTGKCFQTLHGHGSQVLSILLSADGGTLLSSSADNTIKIWDVLTGECLKTLQGHNNWVWSVTLSPNQQLLASGSQDETIKFWQVKTGKCLKKLRVPRPYEGMNITHVTGLTQATMATLKALGAVEV